MTTTTTNNNDKTKEEEDTINRNISYHHFRLFSYLAMTIITVAILVGIYIIIQHLQEEGAAERTLANQETLLENQQLLINIVKTLQNNTKESLENQLLLKALGEDAKSHEMREEGYLGNNTKANINVSKSNSERLDLLLDHFNITYNK